MACEAEPSGRDEGQIIIPGYPPYRLYGTSEDVKGDERVVKEGVEALQQLVSDDSGRPWCLFVGCSGPHDPYVVPQRFLDMYDPGDIELPPNFHDEMRDKPGFYRRTRDIFSQLTEEEHREGIRHYLAYCSYEDDLFGCLLGVLEQSPAAENTLVIYCSDHDDYTGEHGLWAKGLPCFRGAYHVPMVMRWPRGTRNPGRVIDSLVSLADIAPTLLDAAGIDAARAFTGLSLMPFIQGQSSAAWRDALFTQSNGNELYGIQRSIFNREFKFVYNGFDYDELYDLREDPFETRNVVKDPLYNGIVRRLMRRIWQFSFRTGDTCINPYIMVRFAQYGPAIAFRDD